MCGARLEPNALRKWFRVGVCWRHCGANPGSGAGPRCEACRGPNAARSVTSHAPHRLLARSSAPPRPPPHGFAPQRRQHTHTGEVEPAGGSGRFAPQTLRSRPLRSHEKCAERVVAAVCRRQLSDGTTPLPRFACLRPSLYPDRRASEEYRVEAHFSGLRRRVCGVKWPDPPAFAISQRHWALFSFAIAALKDRATQDPLLCAMMSTTVRERFSKEVEPAMPIVYDS
jgi:hypothetical protein